MMRLVERDGVVRDVARPRLLERLLLGGRTREQQSRIEPQLPLAACTGE
jgi:hypothetical protein